MTLATRCTACGTSFRVVQDQLKVSGGWVRCGRCNEVFNALEGLYEIFTRPEDTTDGEQPSPAEDRAADDDRDNDDGTSRAPDGPGAAAPAAARASEPASHHDAPASCPARPPAAEAPAQPEDEVHASPSAAFEDASTRPAAPTEPAPWDERPAPGFEDVETRLEPRAGDELGPMPSFMQHAAKPRNGLTKGQRLFWGGGAAVLATLLVVQLALASRDSLAARLPGLQPMLQAACAALRCSVLPPRNVAALAVEGSNLRQRAGDGFYELVVALRNRSASAVMVPAFELTLTDSQGQALVRRVLTGVDLGAEQAQLAAGAEWSLKAVLDVSDRRIAGYTVEIFYP